MNPDDPQLNLFGYFDEYPSEDPFECVHINVYRELTCFPEDPVYYHCLDCKKVFKSDPKAK